MTRNQFLTEWLGECWHEPYDVGQRSLGDSHHNYYCSKCKKEVSRDGSHQPFSTWPGFGKLWEAAEHPDKVYLCHRLLQQWNVDKAITDYAKSKGWRP